MSTDVGSPQGATVSPLLANICLPYVLDLQLHACRKVSIADIPRCAPPLASAIQIQLVASTSSMGIHFGPNHIGYDIFHTCLGFPS